MINLEPNKRKEMGKNGRKLILEKFDQKIISDIYINAIHKILKD